MHSIWDRERFWDSRTWERVPCEGKDCQHCRAGWPVIKKEA